MIDIKYKIILAFSFIILLLAATGFFLIQSMESLAKETENIYRHPFAVSNATRDIRIHILSIQNDLKESMLSKGGESFGIQVERICLNENKIRGQFERIEERFLGDKQDVKKMIQAFDRWKTQCESIVSLKKKDMNDQALRMMQEQLPQTAKELDAAIQFIADFANAKASEFYTMTLERKKGSLATFTILLAMTIAGSLFILFYVVRNHDSSQREIMRYFHLIDQNIMLASTDKEGKILDISNALCRYLGVTKKAMIGKPSRFFIDEEQADLASEIVTVIETGSKWQGNIKKVFNNLETRWINQAIHPVYNDKYELSSYSHILSDITDKKVLEELSVTDKLTTLLNRRSFDDVIEKEIRMAYRRDSFLTLAMMDIDFFKRYNDNYGHPAGDDVLIQMAGVLKRIVKRPDDYLFRVGGEEFAILFPGTDSSGSLKFLEKIRQSIEELKIIHQYSDVSEHITVSIGSRTYKGTEIPEKNQFYSQADHCLYEAKKQRNKVVSL
ncbi:diguanylate cyclase [uncultured Desulfobacter sp.]|uniref:diguanylate cyclase n=1 Tax=uncultured Desulfobacter sp. TaxID=240139 RepID=UPI002AAB75C3|nr:diguanylate cyclase [uncultured Desulfobacter sp.]